MSENLYLVWKFNHEKPREIYAVDAYNARQKYANADPQFGHGFMGNVHAKRIKDPKKARKPSGKSRAKNFL